MTLVTLYSLARNEASSDRWCDLSVGVDGRQLVARLRQDGIDQRDAISMASEVAQAATQADGQRHTQLFYEAGPWRESYQLLAVVVSVPSALA